MLVAVSPEDHPITFLISSISELLRSSSYQNTTRFRAAHTLIITSIITSLTVILVIVLTNLSKSFQRENIIIIAIDLAAIIDRL